MPYLLTPESYPLIPESAHKAHHSCAEQFVYGEWYKQSGQQADSHFLF